MVLVSAVDGGGGCVLTEGGREGHPHQLGERADSRGEQVSMHIFMSTPRHGGIVGSLNPIHSRRCVVSMDFVYMHGRCRESNFVQYG